MSSGSVCLPPYCSSFLSRFRRRWLTRDGGTFDCSLQLAEKEHGRGWALGLARYVGDDLQWFRVFSLAWWPKLVVNRPSARRHHHPPPDG